MAADLYPMGRLEIDHASRYRLGSTEVASRDRRVRLACLARGCQVRRVRQVRLVRPGRLVRRVRWVRPGRVVRRVRLGRSVRLVRRVRLGRSVRLVRRVRLVRLVRWVHRVRRVRLGRRIRRHCPSRREAPDRPTAESAATATESAAAAESATAAESASTAPTCTAWTAGYAEVDETSRGSMTAGPSGFALRRSAGSVGAATLSPWRLDARRGARHT